MVLTANRPAVVDKPFKAEQPERMNA